MGCRELRNYDEGTYTEWQVGKQAGTPYPISLITSVFLGAIHRRKRRGIRKNDRVPHFQAYDVNDQGSGEFYQRAGKTAAHDSPDRRQHEEVGGPSLGLTRTFRHQR